MCLGSDLSAEEGASGYAWDKLQEGTGEDQHKQTLYGNAITLVLYVSLNKNLINNKEIRITYANTQGTFFFNEGCSF